MAIKVSLTIIVGGLGPLEHLLIGAVKFVAIEKPGR